MKLDGPWVSPAIVGGLAIIAGCSFWAGVSYSRGQINGLAEEMAVQPVNSFTRCLTELWEQSGELGQDWKAKRRWVLTAPTELSSTAPSTSEPQHAE